MSPSVDIDLADGDPSISLSAISRESFPEALWDLMPNCQEGFDEYVRLGTSRPSLRWRRTFWTARVDGEIAGYAEWRDLGGTRFLNHICTRPSMQGLGVARSLIQRPFDGGFTRQRIELDVFDKEPAFTFYQHLGLQSASSSRWHLREAVDFDNQDQEELVSDSIAFFESSMLAFGFSRLEATWRDQLVTVLFPSVKTARLMDTRDFEDIELLAAIKAAVPTVERFAVICPSDTSLESSDVTLPSTRFSGYLSPLPPSSATVMYAQLRTGPNR